ncbi:PAS domain S-box-containing protein [Limimaricola soesokkakensis]|uniref:histidine kinase n=1 Tax=Limimaricola soesokkakensis TaxID=1343159 RepID=A0A1X6YYZ6_9RHOB|nr:PAS domain-containing protein [Limimaricola soesokkakensis]PSK87738.1 PAS domain S-box-containing protein [Limimaricola soesokkakensis]SLN33617.1 Blue-light-activated histidine kinase 2 [Limimaricola soesokkakensis]
MSQSCVTELHRCGAGIEDEALAAALDLLPSPTWVADPVCGGIHFNRAWLEFRGRSLSQEVGRGWFTGIHDEDHDKLDTYRIALSAGRPYQVEYRLRRHDGVWRWMLDTGAPRFAPDGELIGFIGSCVDITARREAEITLAENEARLRSVTENFPGYIFQRIVHPGGRAEYPLFSRAGERDKGGAARFGAEALGQMIHPEDLPAMQARYAEAVSTMSRLDCEGRLVLPDGEGRWIRSLSQPRPRADGALIWDGVMLDITEQREREAALERSAMMLGMSIEIAAIGTWEFDPETGLIAASARAQAMFQLSENEVPRPFEDYLDRVHPEDRAAVCEGMRDARVEGAEMAQVYRLAAPDGPQRWVSMRGRMVRLADGGRRLIGAITDITETKRHEAEREAALTHRQTLLSELNHRMKNNLHLILSMLRLEAGRFQGPASFAAAIERIEAVAALHAQLGFSEGAGRVSFCGYLEDLAAKLRRSLLEGTGIRLDCTAEPLDLDLDLAVPLGIVINELVTNAIKHAFPQGAGLIRLGLTRKADGGLLVVVEDDGYGPERVAPDIPETTSCPGSGSGMGSRLVAGLCAQIGARIESHSLPGMRHEIHLPPQG